jgi:hypothetical protein
MLFDLGNITFVVLAVRHNELSRIYSLYPLAFFHEECLDPFYLMNL